MKLNIRQKVIIYQTVTVFGLLFGFMGFSYNVWRMENTEANNNTRMACFELLGELAVLEQLVYSAHYDNDKVEGNPRVGWVKVGLIADLSVLVSSTVEKKAVALKDTWNDNWEIYDHDKVATERIIYSIDETRKEIKLALRELK